jgi:hypothetical protein
MLGVGPPLNGCCCLQTLEETHDLFRLACLSMNVFGSLPIAHCEPRSYGDRACDSCRKEVWDD